MTNRPDLRVTELVLAPHGKCGPGVGSKEQYGRGMMSNGFALWKGNSKSIDWGELSLDASGRLALRGKTRTAEVTLDPSTVPYVDVYTTQDWMCAVGGADRRLVVGHVEGPRLDAVAELERIKTGDRFEFERHSLRFHDRPGHDQCVLSWEIGVGLVDRQAGLVWSYVHHDVNQRLVRITDETMQLRGLYQTVSVSLTDGTALVKEFAAPPAVNDETLAEWMRGIGR